MKRLSAFLFLLALAFAVSAGQLCTIDPPRPGPSTGFYVVGSKVLNTAGDEFRIRGINRVHSDQNTAGMAAMGANSVRIAIALRKPAAANWSQVQSISIANGLMPIVGDWTGTCSSDPAKLSAIVDGWVEQAPIWTQLNGTGIVNIANEWGPDNNVAWQDAYITAVARMRVAGYTGALMIDAGGCGQSAQDIIKYGAAVLASDPLKNIVFDVHVYGGFHYPATASWMQDASKAFAGMKATGLPIILGEFGPLNVGPSQTQIPLDDLVGIAEANGWGWAAWAADDGGCPGSYTATYFGFSMTRTCWDSQKLGDGNLSPWGMAVVGKLRGLTGRP